MEQSSSNQLRKYNRYFISAGLLGSFLFPCCLIFTIMTQVRQGQAGFVLLGVVGSFLAFTITTLGFGAALWSRTNASEVDDLLEGRNLLAYWDYKIDENGDPQKGYVYIGHSGVYKDGSYFYFQGRGRRLIKVTFEYSRPAKLVFTCTQRNTYRAGIGRKVFAQIVVPVPPGKEQLAESIVRQLKPD